MPRRIPLRTTLWVYVVSLTAAAFTGPRTLAAGTGVPSEPGDAVTPTAYAVTPTAYEPFPPIADSQAVAGARQDTTWDSERVLELVRRARTRRRQPVADSALRTYRAEAAGHIYFFLDREINGEPILLRADQVALDLFWGQPDRTKQVIRGLRSEEQFPIRDFRYYLDRYTVIQNGFGDEIRVGEGRDVADVPHPLAPGAEDVYAFRLADSLTIRLPGDEDLRVYEVQVRPRDVDRPAIVGSLFLERTRGDLVRLAFTFTPSAYLDERNERVEVTLEHGLWEGRYWLPREQRLLVRREIPQLDLDVGTVIRAVLRVSDYEFNPPLSTAFFGGSEVVAAASGDRLADYAFEEGLYDALPDVGLGGGQLGTLDDVDVDRIAGRILRQRLLRGLPSVRFYAPDVSSVLRYNRAEGLVTAAGLSAGLGNVQLAVYGGYTWGAREPLAELNVRPLSAQRTGWILQGYYRRPVHLGVHEPTGALASLSAAGFGSDYRDLYFASGASFGLGNARLGSALHQNRGVLPLQLHTSISGSGRSGNPIGGALGMRVAAHHSPSQQRAAEHAPLDDEAPFRPVLPVTEGTEYALALAGASALRVRGGTLSAALGTEMGRFHATDDGAWFGRLSLNAGWNWTARALHTGVDVWLRGLANWNGQPQHNVLLGGAGTLPGHPFHSFLADRAAILNVEAWRTVVPGWLRIRGIAAAAGISATPGPELQVPGTRPWEPGLGAAATPAALGIGVAFVNGILRVDYARGFGPRATTNGAVIISIDPRLQDIL